MPYVSIVTSASLDDSVSADVHVVQQDVAHSCRPLILLGTVHSLVYRHTFMAMLTCMYKQPRVFPETTYHKTTTSL